MIGLFKQEAKSLFKSPAALSILIIPVVLLIGIGFLLPSAWIIPSSITIGIVATVLLYFGGSIEEIKRTSFMKSISLTKLSKGTYLATKILFSVLISIFIILWVLFFGWAFTSLGLLAEDFHVIIPEGSSDALNFIRLIPFTVNWNEINWLVMFYAGAITIVVSTSMAFLFVTFSSSSLSFYLMSFGYLLAMILFGGIIMPSFLISDDNSGFKILYYLIPNYYTNNEMASSFGSTMGATVHGFTGELANISSTLNGLVDDGLLPAVANAKGDSLTLINAFIHGGVLGKGDNILDFSTDEWNPNSMDGISHFFNVLSSPGGFTWKGGKLDPQHTVIYSGDVEYFDFIRGVLINNLKYDPSSTHNIVINILTSNPTLAPMIERILTGTTSSFDNAAIIGALLPFKDKSWHDLVLALLTNGHDKGSIYSDVHYVTGIIDNIDNTVNGMFAIPFDLSTWKGWLDLTMPWAETALFLGISIRFFKWS